jgi:hypothetical protein
MVYVLAIAFTNTAFPHKLATRFVSHSTPLLLLRLSLVVLVFFFVISSHCSLLHLPVVVRVLRLRSLRNYR